MKAIAICSCPRLGFMDFAGRSIVAFARNGIEYVNVYGVFWAEALSNAMAAAVDDYDYIITTDYDSLYTEEDVANLLRLAQDEKADAVCALQMGRFHGPLFGTKRGETTPEELSKGFVPVSQGHFGLTAFKTDALKDLPKPWFYGKPNENGERRQGKVDPDISFWRNFAASGRNLYLAPRIVIGHIEAMVAWPDADMQPIYSKIGDYNRYGKPPNAWNG